MITSIHCYCLLSGPKFSPRLAKELGNLDVADPVEPMSIGKSGRYKGKPDPCGSGVIVLPLYTNDKEAIAILERIVEARRVLDALEVKLAIYMVFGYRDQCNCELPPKVVASLARLCCPVCISCFEDKP